MAASWDFFPQSPQKFMPYLQGLFVPSASCLQESIFIQQDALSTAAQKVKTAASRMGLYYDLTISNNLTTMTPQVAGERNDFASFDSELWATWFVAKSENNSQGVFIMMELDWGQGCNFNENRSSAQHSLGSLSDPQSALRGGNGPFIPHLSIGYSGWDGKFVAMAGTLDLSNFLDQNMYSADWNGNLLNLSFNYNPCLPLFWANWGYLTAWQPSESFYTVYATTGSNGQINHNPFPYISSNYWLHVVEAGFIQKDVLGMGAGTYRFQYVLSNTEDRFGLGGAFNMQQQLGRESALGCFTRMAYMDEDAASLTGTKAAITGGLVMMAPFTSSGWGSKANNEQVALGFLWQRAADSEEPLTHKDEYGVELSVVIQLTPTLFIQPDVQYIFNPVHAQDKDGAFVFQLQSTLRF